MSTSIRGGLPAWLAARVLATGVTTTVGTSSSAGTTTTRLAAPVYVGTVVPDESQLLLDALRDSAQAAESNDGPAPTRTSGPSLDDGPSDGPLVEGVELPLEELEARLSKRQLKLMKQVPKHPGDPLAMQEAQLHAQLEAVRSRQKAQAPARPGIGEPPQSSSAFDALVTQEAQLRTQISSVQGQRDAMRTAAAAALLTATTRSS